MKEDQDQKINVNVSTLGGSTELIIRHGEAAKVNEPTAFATKTTIDGPLKYFDGIAKHVESVKRTAVVSVNSVKGLIQLNVNPENGLSAVITGILQKNPQVESFRVNSEKRWTGDELAAHIYANANIFNVPTKDVRNFAAKFRNLKAKISKEIEDTKDDAGNIVDNFVQKVSVEDLPKLPFFAMVYIGGEKFEFPVEVGIEAVSRGVVFYLFSAELAALLESEKEKALQEVTSEFTQRGICVIEVV